MTGCMYRPTLELINYSLAENKQELLIFICQSPSGWVDSLQFNSGFLVAVFGFPFSLSNWEKTLKRGSQYWNLHGLPDQESEVPTLSPMNWDRSQITLINKYFFLDLFQFFCSMASTFTLNFCLSGIFGYGWGSFNQPGLLNFGDFSVR